MHRNCRKGKTVDSDSDRCSHWQQTDLRKSTAVLDLILRLTFKDDKTRLLRINVRGEVPRRYSPLTAVGHIALRLDLHGRLLALTAKSVSRWIREFCDRWCWCEFLNIKEAF